MQGSLKKGVQIDLRDALNEVLPFARGEIGVAVQRLQIQAAHNKIQRRALLLAQVGIKAEGDERALLIVAGDGVGAIFVLFVVFMPCGEAGLGECLLFAPSIAVHAGDVLHQQMQISFGANHLAAGEHQVVIIGCDAFIRPELLGVGFCVQIVGHKFGRLNGFHIPCVEIFVGD